jgi:hypothetical protein
MDADDASDFLSHDPEQLRWLNTLRRDCCDASQRIVLVS